MSLANRLQEFTWCWCNSCGNKWSYELFTGSSCIFHRMPFLKKFQNVWLNQSLSNRLFQTSRELRVWWCCVLGCHSREIYKAFNDWKHCANFSHLVSYTHFSILAVPRNSFSKILMFEGKNPSHFYPKAHQKDFRTETRQWIVCPGFRVAWIECIERSTLELSAKVAGLEQQF